MPDQLDLGDVRFSADLKCALVLAQSLQEAAAVRRYAPLAERDRSGIGVAVLSAMLTVNAILAAAAAQCTRTKPAADIEIQTASDGRLIYRCQHSNSHSWELDGTVI